MGRIIQWIAFLLHTQRPQVRFSAFSIFFFFYVPEIYWWHCLEQWTEAWIFQMNPSRGKLVLRKQTKKLFCQHWDSNPRPPQLYLPVRARTFLTGICISPTYLSCWISMHAMKNPESFILKVQSLLHPVINQSKVQRFKSSIEVIEFLNRQGLNFYYSQPGPGRIKIF